MFGWYSLGKLAALFPINRVRTTGNRSIKSAIKKPAQGKSGSKGSGWMAVIPAFSLIQIILKSL